MAQGKAERQQNLARIHERRRIEKIHSSSSERAKEDFETCRLLDETGKVQLGEVLSYTDLCSIFYGVDRAETSEQTSKYLKEKKQVIRVSGKKILSEARAFDEWLDMRSLYRRDFWEFMGMARPGWSEQAHKPVAEFFGNKDNTMLKPGYSEDDLNEFVKAQGDLSNYLLLYPRGFRKSSIDNLDAAHWIVNSHGDIVILVITSTNPLGAKFMHELRKYFSVKDYSKPTNFQLIFPEHCIPEGHGDKHVFRSPAGHLDLKDPNLSQKSMEAGGFAGTRAHILKFDDPVDEENWKTPKSRQDIIDKFDAANELLVPPYGRCYTIGTRWTEGLPADSEEGAIRDLYGTILAREEIKEQSDLKKIISPAWTVREHAKDKKLIDLEEHDVDLLWPGKGPGSFAELKKKRDKKKVTNSRNYDTSQFECQQLNRPVAKVDDEIYVNHFTDELLTECMTNYLEVQPKFEGRGRKFIFWDTAHSTKRTADSSTGAAFFIEEGKDIDPIAYLLEIHKGHWKSSELAQHIVAFHKKWDITATFIEELATTSDLFKREIYAEQQRQNCSRFDPVWFPPDSSPKAKESRISALEPLMATCRFKICIGMNTNAVAWIDELKKQFIGYTGHKSNKNYVSGRKDDIPDVCGNIYKVMPVGKLTEEDRDRLKKVKEKIEMERRYKEIFGIGVGTPPSIQLSSGEEKDVNVGRGIYGIPGLRSTSPVPQQEQKPLSFGMLRRNNG